MLNKLCWQCYYINHKLTYLLHVFEFGEARITDTHIKLKTHHRNGSPTCTTTVTHCASTVAAMMLPEAQLALVHHGTKVPEEWASTSLTAVRLMPLWGLTQNITWAIQLQGDIADIPSSESQSRWRFLPQALSNDTVHSVLTITYEPLHAQNKTTGKTNCCSCTPLLQLMHCMKLV